MVKRSKLNRQEVEELVSPEQLVTMKELYELGRVLGGCIVGRDYKPTDSLLEAIRLSSYGNWLLAQKMKYEFQIREARLTCLLELYHLDLLVDLEQTDPDLVAAAISEEMLSGRLTYPFAFGPGLYMQAADLFPEERRFLNAGDSRRLLENQPAGVFQSGRWLGGPFGLFKSDNVRRLGPSLNVPLQHCHDVSCWRVHTVRLSSDSTAEINKSRHGILQALESEGEDPSEFAPVLTKLFKDPNRQFDDEDFGAIPFLVGDGLSDTELRSLIHQLLNGPSSSSFRPSVGALTKRKGTKEEITDGLDRSSLMQMALLASDLEIVAALDALVFVPASDGGVVVPRGEVRRSVLTHTKSGAYGNRPELSRLGVRVNSSINVAPLRLRRLVKEIYLPTSDRDTEASPVNEKSAATPDLDWQLRAIPGERHQCSVD